MLRHAFRSAGTLRGQAAVGKRFAAQIPGPTLDEFQALGPLTKMDKIYMSMWEKYGDINMIPAGAISTKQVLMFHHPRDIEVVMRNEGKNPIGFATRIAAFEYYNKKHGYDSSLGRAVGETWRTIRGALQKGMFGPRDVIDYLPVLSPVHKDLATALPGHGKDMGPHLSNTAFDMINTVLFGVPLGVATECGSATEADRKYVQSASNAVSGLRALMLDPATIAKFEEDPETCEAYLLYESCMEQMKGHGNVLLQRCIDHLGEEGPAGDAARRSYVAGLIKAGKLNKGQIVNNVMDFLFAGVDTTSSSMFWLMYHLASNPEQQAQLRGLIRESFGSQPGQALPMTAELWQKSAFLKWAVKEMYRCSPIQMGTARLMPHDFTVGDYEIKEGDHVQVIPLPYLRDERVWGSDASSYRFTRWDRSEKVKAAEGADPMLPDPSWKHDPFISLHFSRGPRMCIGSRLAEIEMAGWIAEILQRYNVEIADDSPAFEGADYSMLLGRPGPEPTFKITPATD